MSILLGLPLKRSAKVACKDFKMMWTVSRVRERQVNLGIFFSVLKGLQIYFSSGAISPDGSVVFFPSIIMTGIADNVWGRSQIATTDMDDSLLKISLPFEYVF